MSRLFVLFGTGDWAPWCDELFAELAVPGRHAAVIAAGQAENGPRVVDEYRRGAAERVARAGVPNVDVPLLNRSDADDPAATACLENAAFLYVLGGGPRGQVSALRGSRFWRHYLDTSLPYVGSSGGAMLLGARYPTSDRGHVDSGLGVFPNTVIAAHWNELDENWRRIFLDLAGDDLLVAIDVDAALVGDGSTWVVHGPGDAHVRGPDGWRRYSAGARVSLHLT
ncbi:hypothetical protein [Kribbella sp. HUAS MG21]|uniref:Peptidase n=1 Tax=Kribbella sp. HUAS MG21 TaxID=3160966 RepID=A0AAU7TM68_9ACTN